MDKLHDWPDASSLRAPVRKQLDAALDFLMSARCFLHFRHGRDDNTLSWEAQDEAAARKIGAPDATELRPPTGCGFTSDTRALCSETVLQLMEEIPESWSALVAAISGMEIAAVDIRISPWWMG